MADALFLGLQIAGWLVLVLALAGCGYTLVAAETFARFMARAAPAPVSDAAVTLLKPLHGDEPQLVENLSTFLAQAHGGPIQLLCGVHNPDDPAIAAVERLRALHPNADIALVVDQRIHGANRKISNLVNMTPHARHPVLVLSDSDMAVPRDYLAQVLAVLEPGGGVSCLYCGRGDSGFWSHQVAAMLSYQFLPGLLFSHVRGLARPCMGSTIALHADTLAANGGFERFLDVLADDHAIGEMIHEAGGRVAIPPMLVRHAGSETSLGAAWRHEMRWSVTTRGITPAGFAGTITAMPLPVAVVAALLCGNAIAGAAVVAAAFASRLWLKRRIDRAAGFSPIPWWMMPFRDSLTLAVYLATYFARSVDWRGAQLTLEDGGRISAERRQFP